MSDGRLRRSLSVLLFATLALPVAAFAARSASRRGLLDTPAPAIVADLAPPPQPDASAIAAPIRVPLGTLVDQLEEAVPRRFGSLEEKLQIPDRDRTSIAFELTRAPFEVSIDGNVARLETTVSYALRAWYDPPVLPEVSASCGTGRNPPPRLRVAIEAPITVDDEWRLASRARVVRLERATMTDRDRCTMTFLDFDVTDRITTAARSFLEGHTADIDAAAARVDLRSQVEEWWSTVQAPIRLTDSLWLVLRPEAVKTAPPQGSGGNLEIALSMRARPGILMGGRPPLAPATLPPLDTGAVAPGLDLILDALAEYGAVSAFLQSEVGGTEIERAGRKVRLDSLRVFGIGGGRLALEVMTSGDVVSHLYLTGTPDLDPTTGRFSIPDLDYDFRTRSLLIATVSWLGNSSLRQILRERASWPATPAVEWLRDRLAEGLNRDLSDHLRVAGDVAGLRVVGIHAMQDLLMVRVSAKASAQLFVREAQPGGPTH